MEFFKGYLHLDNLIGYDVIKHDGKDCIVFPIAENGCVKIRTHFSLPFLMCHYKAYVNNFYIKTQINRKMKESLMLDKDLFIGNAYRKQTQIF